MNENWNFLKIVRAVLAVLHLCKGPCRKAAVLVAFRRQDCVVAGTLGIILRQQYLVVAAADFVLIKL